MKPRNASASANAKTTPGFRPGAVTADARPLTARSVAASTLLGTTPPRLPARVLVAAGGLFGIAEGTVRVALSRMVAAGELRSDDGWYELVAPRLLGRQAGQQEGRTVPERGWDGRWITAVVIAETRTAAQRARLRDELRARRMGELREGVWLRPTNLGTALPSVAAEQCVTFLAAEVPGGTVSRLWDLDGWAARARALRAGINELTRPLERGDTSVLAEGFVRSAAVLRAFRADPLLPAELLPARWPGGALRGDYERFDVAYRALLRRWFAANAT